ncbi:hypothetical protein M2324_003715 [Rhodovulum sulfidophilum]|nr:hypothetical protein [Rhodovulum sulfidophilum]
MIGVTQFTCYRWCKERAIFRHRSKDNGKCGLKTYPVKRLKDLEKENERLRKAVSELTLENLILREAASVNDQDPAAAEPVSITSGRRSPSRSASPVVCLGSIARHGGRCRGAAPTKTR